MAEAPDLTVREQVALAVAATAAGDETLSGTLLRQLLREAGERQGPWVRIVSTNGGDDTAVLTARLAIVAAWLGEPVAADMDAYIASSPPKTTLVDLEQAVAAQGWVRRLPAADASAALVIDGKRSVLRIKGSRPVTVVLTPAQAADATLEPRSGSVIVATRTDEPLDASSLEAPSWLEVSRAVKPSGTIGLADTVVVVLRVTRPPKATPGCLAVTELVPSGLVPVAPLESWYDDEEEGGGANPGTEEPSQVIGQRVEFCVDGHANSPAVKLRYVARVVTPGTYRWEPTLLQVSGNPGLGTVIPATKVTITTTR